MQYLVAVDGSESSMDALRYAVEQAAATGAEVTAVSVVVPEQFFTGGDDPPASYAAAADELVAEDVEDAEEEAQEVLDEAAEIGEKTGVEVETGLLYGEPVEVLSEFAADEDYDAIFVGHRGHSERYEGLVGSTAKEIVGRATVPVTVVR
ncbi:universal stress protein [Halorussus gelatinilyticus]|uniref:Universal stress protein n=1 Tax=Halorussus gelatinilyticus TaxID=2937524 RepID=A0A8U0IIH3_9EURY|nr:universal stress protein [Halorussus gelatinilyticus]UPW00471.1 universal stress protein [Halorussus gelatinilyticus]